jgi:hypothetical protein
MMLHRAAGWAVCATLCAHSLEGQTIHGRVLMPDSATPARGVTVVVVNDSGAVVRRGIADATGSVLLGLQRPGRYQIRAIRIGFAPSTSMTSALGATDTARITIVLDKSPVILASARVAGVDQCGSRADGGAAFVEVWEQARSALADARFVRSSDGLDVRALVISGLETRVGSFSRDDSVTAREVISSSGFGGTSPDSLLTFGFVRRRADGSTVFDAPNPETLLSDAFAARYCFAIDRSTTGERDLLGITFRPAPGASGSPVGIEGRLWIRQASAAPVSLEFNYVGLSSIVPDTCRSSRDRCESSFAGGGLGGSLRFATTDLGRSFVSHWILRAPVEDDVAVFSATGSRIAPNAQGGTPCAVGPNCRRVFALSAGFKLVAGDVVSIKRASELIFQDSAATTALNRVESLQAGRRPGAFHGVVTDMAGAPVTGALVQIESPSRMAKTDSQGAFALEKLPARAVGVIIRAQGFSPVQFELRILPDSTRSSRISLVRNGAPPFQ